MRSQRINRFFSIFILTVFFIAGLYQSFDLADSFLVCHNGNSAAIFEESFVDHTQDVFVENTSPSTQVLFNRRESDTDTFDLRNTFYWANSISSERVTGIPAVCFGNIIQENCLKHFCRAVITNYIHLTDGQKIF